MGHLDLFDPLCVHRPPAQESSVRGGLVKKFDLLGCNTDPNDFNKSNDEKGRCHRCNKVIKMGDGMETINGRTYHSQCSPSYQKPLPV